MSDARSFASIIDEYSTMPADAPVASRLILLEQALALVDRDATPKKWAALRCMVGDLLQDTDPVKAIGAYCDALTVWREEEDPDPWLHCCQHVKILIATRCLPGSADGHAAMRHIERVIDSVSALEELLGTLFGYEMLGDPFELWTKRITYLERAASRVSPARDVVSWARVNNEVALAYAEEPGADYARAMERRIDRHALVLAGLAEDDAPYAATCLHMATACLNRVNGSLAENGARAMTHVRNALAASDRTGNAEVKAQALLLLARCLTFKELGGRPGSLYDALDVLEQARPLVDPASSPQLLASLEKSIALARLELMESGAADQLEPIATHCDAALALLVHDTDIDERRIVFQIKADALFSGRDFSRAASALADAITASETLLARATTTAGRLERIWSLRDSTSKLAFCFVSVGRPEAAIQALERGKARFWTADSGIGAAALADAIPDGGAMLFPIFAGDEGVVLIATRAGGEAALTPVPLPGFGLAQVMALQRGANPEQLGGWLYAYCFRRSQPQTFRDAIRDVGFALGEGLWKPIRAALDTLGIAKGAELVWLPQGAMGALPVQAAWHAEGDAARWILDDYAIRYAPALKVLRGRSEPDTAASTSPLVVANPTGDLAFSAFEVEWILQASAGAHVLSGDDADRARVIAGLRTSTYVHFATHADFNLDDPFASAVQLAGGDRLTLGEWATLVGSHGPDTIVLSACETAVTRVTSMADEFLGFPAALLAHGARTVLATQWPVNDEATALLVGEFYRRYSQQRMSAAQALRDAQNWLRALTNARLAEAMRALRDVPGAVGALASQVRIRVRGRSPDARPFEHPYYWAAFTVSGDGR